MMGYLDIASYRRVAERWASKDEDINPSMAAVLMLQMCSEIERLQKADYEFQEKLADGITDAFLERRWIPVGERMPEIGVSVLCSSNEPPGEDLVWIGQREEYDWYFPGANEMGTPSHWMPLPEPPAV